MEAVAQEVAPFDIDFLLVEPGPTATSFAAGLDHGEPMPVYDATPAGEMRRGLTAGSFAVLGDAARTVDAIVAAADAEHPPLRLTLSSTAYASIRTALTRRLEGLKAQREIALGADKA